MLTKADIEKYFIAEKHESLVFLVIGIAVIVLALIFYFAVKTQIYRGRGASFIDTWTGSGRCRIYRIYEKRRSAHQPGICL